MNIGSRVCVDIGSIPKFGIVTRIDGILIHVRTMRIFGSINFETHHVKYIIEHKDITFWEDDNIEEI